MCKMTLLEALPCLWRGARAYAAATHYFDAPKQRVAYHHEDCPAGGVEAMFTRGNLDQPVTVKWPCPVCGVFTDADEDKPCATCAKPEFEFWPLAADQEGINYRDVHGNIVHWECCVQTGRCAGFCDALDWVNLSHFPLYMDGATKMVGVYNFAKMRKEAKNV